MGGEDWWRERGMPDGVVLHGTAFTNVFPFLSSSASKSLPYVYVPLARVIGYLQAQAELEALRAQVAEKDLTITALSEKVWGSPCVSLHHSPFGLPLLYMLSHLCILASHPLWAEHS